MSFVKYSTYTVLNLKRRWKSFELGGGSSVQWRTSITWQYRHATSGSSAREKAALQTAIETQYVGIGEILSRQFLRPRNV